MTAESETFAQIAQDREQMKEERQKEREEAFMDMDEFRGNYKTEM
jgi:DMSO/TMAO reductase YedYZ molybdopterin-dependent catalytic subunit